MSCGELLLLTNVTREPAGTVSVFGETPLAVMVIVSPPPGDGVGVGVGVGEGDGVGDGVVGDEPPPQAAVLSATVSAAQPIQVNMVRIRRTSSRY